MTANADRRRQIPPVSLHEESLRCIPGLNFLVRKVAHVGVVAQEESCSHSARESREGRAKGDVNIVTVEVAVTLVESAERVEGLTAHPDEDAVKALDAGDKLPPIC
ncbi:MAG: hypothetical protein R2737_14920 [Candidatus Nanopelagicales bacterium]